MPPMALPASCKPRDMKRHFFSPWEDMMMIMYQKMNSRHADRIGGVREGTHERCDDNASRPWPRSNRHARGHHVEDERVASQDKFYLVNHDPAAAEPWMVGTQSQVCHGADEEGASPLRFARAKWISVSKAVPMCFSGITKDSKRLSAVDCRSG
jgi:hypothetical protein